MKRERPNNIAWRLKYALSDYFFLPLRKKKKNSEIPNRDRISLNPSERKRIKELYGNLCNKSSFSCFEFYKGYCGKFDERYAPNDYYFIAECLMNRSWASAFMSHKCCLKYFIPKENTPRTIIQNVNGHMMNGDNEDIEFNHAVELLEKSSVFFYKNALNTGGGVGVYRIEVDKIEGSKGDLFKRLLDGRDYIIQESVKQSTSMSQFNPSSVNTIRVLSLNLNGCCTVLSSFIRMGGKGSYVDNLHGGTGGVLVGIDNDGCLNTWGINKYYDRQNQSPCGIFFNNTTIDAYDKVKSFVINSHKKMKEVNLIGWDIALDFNDNPIVIEINLGSADIAAHQVFNGPVFGNRTQEVIDYVNANLKDLRFSF